MLTPVVDKLGVKPRAALAPEEPEWDAGIGAQQSKVWSIDSNKEPMAELLARAMRAEAKQKIRQNRSGKYLIEIGDFHFSNKSFRRAEKAYKEASIEPGYKVQAYRKLINLYGATGNAKESITVFNSLIEMSVKKPNYYVEKIGLLLNHFSEENKEELQKTFRTALKTFPSNTEILNLRGIFSLITNEFRVAETYFDKVLKLDSNNVHASNNKGVVRFWSNDNEGAEKYYWKAISINLKYVTGYENLAALYTKLEKHAKALKVLSDAKENGNKLSNEWDHQYGYLLLKSGKQTQALEWYSNKILEEPDNSLLNNNLGFCFEITGDIKKARENYSLAIKKAKILIEKNAPIDERWWLAFYNLMNLLDKSQSDVELSKLVSYVMSYRKNDWRALFFRGSVELRADNYTESLLTYEKVKKINPDFVDTYVQMGFLYESVWKNYDESIKLHKKASELFKAPNPVIENNLAFAYLKSGQLAKAKSVLKPYKNFKGYAPLQATWGLYYFMIKQPDEANKMYEKALKKFTGSDREKKVMKQVWFNEKARYEFSVGDISVALTTINSSIGVLDHGYSYKDALEIKERIIGEAQSILLEALAEKN